MKLLILAGGTGSRLWPLSRLNSPKHTQLRLGKRTLLEQTFSRIRKGFNVRDIFVSTNRTHAKEVSSQLPKTFPKSHLFIEPVQRGTTVAIGFAAVILQRKYPKETLAPIWSDHFLEGEWEYLRLLRALNTLAHKHENTPVLAGINPTYPETGYGYIELGKELGKVRSYDVFSVRRFVEKPSLPRAKQFLRRWNYLWNPGVTVWKLATLVKLLEKHTPSLYRRTHSVSGNIQQIMNRVFPRLPVLPSLEYTLLEKVKSICVPTNLRWADIGHWRAVYDVLAASKGANVVQGKWEGIDTENSLIYNFSDRLVATVGLKDIIVVDSGDAILVAAKSQAQDIKKLVARLRRKQKNRDLI